MKKLTILLAVVALVCFSVPAMAVDWNFYGSARIATYYISNDYGDGLNPAGTDDKDAHTEWDMQGNSRIGANIKAENLKGQFEWGVSSDANGGGNVAARRLYGVWNFGPGTLKVGKDYTPVSQFISGQVFDADLGLLGVGTMYGNREAQVAFGFGNFEVALIQPKADLIQNMSNLSASTSVVVGGVTFSVSYAAQTFHGNPQSYLPKLEAKWGMSFDAWNFNVMGGYQYYSIADVTSFVDGKNNDIDVTSYLIGGDVGFNFGPGYVKAAVSYGQNIGSAAWGLPSLAGGTSGQGGNAVWDGDDDTNDTTTFMGALVAGLKVSDTLSFEAGYGYRHDGTDGGTQRNTSPWAVYVQSVIALAPGVWVIPEVGYYDYDNNYLTGDDAGTQFYIGGKWQIDF